MRVVDCLAASVPFVAEIVSHWPPILVEALACQKSVPPSVLERVSGCVDGLVCPLILLNESVAGLADSNGVADCARVKLTKSVSVPTFELKMTVPV